MKKFFSFIVVLALVAIMTACTMSTSELADEVKKSMNETWAKEGNGLHCEQVVLVHSEGNNYEGTATVSADGETETVSVSVVYDGEAFQWIAL